MLAGPALWAHAESGLASYNVPVGFLGLVAFLSFGTPNIVLAAEPGPEDAKQSADAAFGENTGAKPGRSGEAVSSTSSGIGAQLGKFFSKEPAKRKTRIPSPENFGVDPDSKKGFWENALGDAAALLSIPLFGLAVVLMGPIGALALAAGGAIAGSLTTGDPLVGIYSVMVWPMFTSMSIGAKLGAKIDRFFKSR